MPGQRVQLLRTDLLKAYLKSDRGRYTQLLSVFSKWAIQQIEDGLIESEWVAQKLRRAEDTFEHDVPLAETELMIRRLADKVWSASRKESRTAYTVVLKLKTSEFNILTRSRTPCSPPSSCEELTNIALSLRERVDTGPQQLFRLVGVGLSNFREPRQPEDTLAQPALFD